ncbi:MAG: hypothetical protein J7M19_06865 [Planctomycetes bacterium]|nr:hypothetical protein [Planctomycetota bacterium]
MSEPRTLWKKLMHWFPTLTRVALVGLFILCALAVVVSVAAVIYDISSSAKLRDARQAAADANVPLLMKAVLAKHPVPDDSKNAACYYEAAFSLLRAKGKGGLDDLLRSNALNLTPDEALPEEFVADLHARISEYGCIIDVLHSGASRQECVYYIRWDGINTLLPHLTRARRCARLLNLATLLAAEENRPSDGIRLVRDNLALSRSLAEEPLLVSNLVSQAIGSIATAGGLQRLVSRTDIPADDLVSLQKEIERLADEFSIRPALEGDLAIDCDFHNSILAGRSAVESTASLVGGKSDSNVAVSVFDRMPLFLKKGYIKGDMTFLISFYLELFDKIDSGVLISPAEQDAFRQRAESGPYVIARMLLPAISRSVEQTECRRARLLATAAALAALRFSRDHNRWPASLDALVPDYLAKVPADPFSGAPLIYKILDDGIIVYCVGLNRTDDGGKPSLVKPADGDKGDYDDYNGFRIWRRAARGPGDEAE